MRPCPFVSCRYHLAIDVLPSGKVRPRFRRIDKMTESCTLDVAQRTASTGAIEVEDVARFVKLTRQRIKHVIEEAVARLKFGMMRGPGVAAPVIAKGERACRTCLRSFPPARRGDGGAGFFYCSDECRPERIKKAIAYARRKKEQQRAK